MDNFLDYIINKESGYYNDFFWVYSSCYLPKSFQCKNILLYCSICLCNVKSKEYITQYQCHSFHKKCINKWLKINNNCPLCRKILD